VDVTGIALVVGIPASIATTVWGIYGGGRWTRRQFIKVQEMWRNQKQMHADIKTLQEQVTALQDQAQQRLTGEFEAMKMLGTASIALDALQQDVAQLKADIVETKEVREGQAEINSYLKGFYEDIETRLVELQQLVKELDKGGWLRIGKKPE
jgi:peptidoglycan hydrolase CwlO-like protein